MLIDNNGKYDLYRYEDRKYSDLYSGSIGIKYGVGGVKKLYRFAKQYISFKDKSVIDCGCGHGILCTLDDIDKSKYVGVDICSYQVNVLKNRYPNILFMHSPIQEIIFKEKEFDISFCCDVLEHIPLLELDTVIKKIIFISKYCVLNIATRSSIYDKGKDQRDKLHQIVKNSNWWRRQIEQYGEIIIEDIDKKNYNVILKNKKLCT